MVMGGTASGTTVLAGGELEVFSDQDNLAAVTDASPAVSSRPRTAG